MYTELQLEKKAVWAFSNSSTTRLKLSGWVSVSCILSIEDNTNVEGGICSKVVGGFF